MSEDLSGYLSMTASGRARNVTATRATSSPQTHSRVETQRRAEELWDALGDFA